MTDAPPREFEQALIVELLASERKRLTVLAVFAVIVTIYVIVVFQVSPPQMKADSVAAVGTAGAALAVLFTAFAGYALVNRTRIGSHLANQRRLPNGYGYRAVVFEITFVTGTVALLALVTDPAALLVSPIFGLHAALIASTALQMNARVSLWATVVAAVEYLLFHVWILAVIEPAGQPDWLVSERAAVSRIVALALIGGASAFVASQFRHRVVRVLATIEERNQVRATFGRHVSPQVVDRLIGQGDQPVSERRYVCVMFLDIRDFTALSEGQNPETLVATLNELFTFMVDAVNAHEGFINKFLGDGFMAVFGAPLSSGQDVPHAVQAARTILHRLEDYNRRTNQRIRVGIGLHAGEALTGNIGSETRTEYTVMGDVVNVASRIESLSKDLSAFILASDAVFEKLSDHERSDAEDMGPRHLKGRSEPVHIYRFA